MQSYLESTPTTTLFNGERDLDIFRSSYANIKSNTSQNSTVVVDAKYVANLPGISFDFYGDTSYWRAILAFNGLNDPISDIYNGLVLKLPDRVSIDSFFAAIDATTVNRQEVVLL